MKRILGWFGLMAAVALLVSGCSDSDKDNESEETPAAAASTGSSSGNTGAAQNTPVADNAGAAPEPSADAQFAAIVPTDTYISQKRVVNGQPLIGIRTDPIPGAVSYTFTTSLGLGGTVAKNEIYIQVTQEQNNQSFVVRVFATNANGVKTKTDTATVN